MTNLATQLAATAQRVPDKAGIKLDQAVVPWGALYAAATAVAGYPRRLSGLDELPKGPTGKILRREVSPPV